VYFYTKWRLAVSSCETGYRRSSSTAVLWTLASVWGLKATRAATTGRGGGRRTTTSRTRTKQEQEQLYTNLIEFTFHCR